MKETLYTRAAPKDREEIVDFANYVFSQAHRPHEFKSLLPKTYADEVVGMEDWHFIARQGSSIRAMVACRPLEMHFLQDTLKCGFIGTVSVHPYSRGEGHMKKLMQMAMEDGVSHDVDLFILGGQRQRYNYFGFDHAGLCLRYTVTETNIRHTLKNVDASDITFTALTEKDEKELDFCRTLSDNLPIHGTRPKEEYLRIMRSWYADLFLIKRNDTPIGYIVGSINEVALKEEKDLFPVLKAYLPFIREKEVSLDVSPYEKERVQLLSQLSENVQIANFEMIRICHFPKVVETLLRFKSAYMPLEDGCVTLQADENPSFTVRVEKGVPTVKEEGKKADIHLSALNLQRLLFSLESAVCPTGLPVSWLPLPFLLSSVDTF